MAQKENTPNKNLGKWIGLAVALMAVPELILPIAVIWGIVWAVKKVLAAQAGSSAKAVFPQKKLQASFDDCPKPLFCFHKDKGEHHVRRGKEIDPWDRPDIDIRKYQRPE